MKLLLCVFSPHVSSSIVELASKHNKVLNSIQSHYVHSVSGSRFRRGSLGRDNHPLVFWNVIVPQSRNESLCFLDSLKIEYLKHFEIEHKTHLRVIPSKHPHFAIARQCTSMFVACKSFSRSCMFLAPLIRSKVVNLPSFNFF